MIDKYKALPILRELKSAELKKFTPVQKKIIIRKFITTLAEAANKYNYDCSGVDYQSLRQCIANELEYNKHAFLMDYMLARFIENIDELLWKEQKNAKKA